MHFGSYLRLEAYVLIEAYVISDGVAWDCFYQANAAAFLRYVAFCVRLLRTVIIVTTSEGWSTELKRMPQIRDSRTHFDII